MFSRFLCRLPMGNPSLQWAMHAVRVGRRIDRVAESSLWSCSPWRGTEFLELSCHEVYARAVWLWQEICSFLKIGGSPSDHGSSVHPWLGWFVGARVTYVTGVTPPWPRRGDFILIVAGLTSMFSSKISHITIRNDMSICWKKHKNYPGKRPQTVWGG